MVILAGIIGALSGVFGTAISASQNNLATGPVIVLVASVFVVISLVLSPERGLLFRELRFRKNRKDIKLMKTLHVMYDIVKDHGNISHPHAIRILNDFQGFTKGTLKKMQNEGWIELRGNEWAMTKKGFAQASEGNMQPKYKK